MSPATDNFIHSLVEMSKAFEELPSVKSELDQAKAEADTLARSVQAREESIARLKAEIESLHARVRDTEAQRDDAELRFLEADDRTHKAVDFIKTTFGSAGSLIQALEPPAEVVPVKEPEHPQGQSEPLPSSATSSEAFTVQTTSAESIASQSENASSSHPTPAPVDPTTTGTESVALSSEPQGQSAADPTVDGARAQTESVLTPSRVSENASPPDDVGYHNEPSLEDSHWTHWDAWAERMNAKHGIGQWPTRPQQVSA